MDRNYWSRCTGTHRSKLNSSFCFSLCWLFLLFLLLPLRFHFSSFFPVVSLSSSFLTLSVYFFSYVPFMSFLLLVSSPLSYFSLAPFIPSTTKIFMQEKITSQPQVTYFPKANYTVLHKKKSHEDHKLRFPSTSS